MKEKLMAILESAESAIYWDSRDSSFIEKIADHLIANGVTVCDWIPVTQKLPTKWAEYLVMIEGAEKSTTLYYDPERNMWYEPDDGVYRVSCWMPMRPAGRERRRAHDPKFKCYIYRTGGGGVIGEFVCDQIFEIETYYEVHNELPGSPVESWLTWDNAPDEYETTEDIERCYPASSRKYPGSLSWALTALPG